MPATGAPAAYGTAGMSDVRSVFPTLPCETRGGSDMHLTLSKVVNASTAYLLRHMIQIAACFCIKCDNRLSTSAMRAVCEGLHRPVLCAGISRPHTSPCASTNKGSSKLAKATIAARSITCSAASQSPNASATSRRRPSSSGWFGLMRSPRSNACRAIARRPSFVACEQGRQAWQPEPEV